MNKLNFNQSVGFPLETDILHEMQKAWTIFNALGAISGNFSIISGCVTVGTNVSDGVVFINGEVLEFKGGLAQDHVIIVEEPQALEFEDGNAHDVVFARYATFGTATTQWLWSDFKQGMETKLIPAALEDKEDKTTIAALIERIEDLEARPESNIPIGLIAIWGQPVGDIPTGWEPYEPLKGRMPVGLDTTNSLFDTLLDYGGSESHTLTIAEMPEHDHDLPKDGGGSVNMQSLADTSNNDEGFGMGTRTGKTGGGEAFDIMNPYRVVHFIQYVG